MSLKTGRQWLLLLLQVVILFMLVAKYAYDRHQYPRIWVRTATYDPSLVVRGRYVALSLEVSSVDSPLPKRKCETPSTEYAVRSATNGKDCWEDFPSQHVHLEVKQGKLVAIHDEHGFHQIRGLRLRDDEVVWILSETVPYFIPEHAWDPTRHEAKAEVWAEVTVPPKGPPRVIQLALKRDGNFRPLQF